MFRFPNHLSQCNDAHDLIELEEYLKQKFADAARED
jgi:hypothetical protein